MHGCGWAGWLLCEVVAALNFEHPLRAALRLPASPSRDEGEVWPPLRFAKGDALSAARRRGMHGRCWAGELLCDGVAALNFGHPLRAALCLPASPSRGEGEVWPPLRFAKGDGCQARRGMLGCGWAGGSLCGVVSLNFEHPLRAALCLPASPSRGEGEGWSPSCCSRGMIFFASD